jgi:hypothetical protein
MLSNSEYFDKDAMQRSTTFIKQSREEMGLRSSQI